MEFKTATDRIAALNISQDVLAQALGVTQSTVARARLDQDNPNARPAPAGWAAVVATLLRARAAELVRLADELERRR